MLGTHMTNDFSSAEIDSALTAARDAVPENRRGALVAISDPNGVRAVIAMKIGQSWTIAGVASWHGGDVAGGISVQASW